MDVAWLLVEGGADIHKASNDGPTALQIARQKKHKEIVKLLRQVAKA